MKNSFLAIIPARSGSKRLPNKNILKLNNKPLITYTIEAALNSRYIDDVMVSSDGEEIIDIAKAYGAQVPFIRPTKLSQDNTKSIDVVKHTIKYYKEVLKKEYDYIILLQPTSPLRDSNDIDNAIELLYKKNADAIISVCMSEHPPAWTNKLDDTLSMNNFLRKEDINSRSQDYNEFYRLNGAIYICKTSLILEKNTFFIDEKIYAYKMSNEHSIDIDTKLDFLLASTILKGEI